MHTGDSADGKSVLDVPTSRLGRYQHRVNEGEKVIDQYLQTLLRIMLGFGQGPSIR